MDFDPVTSSMIEAIGHDPETSTLGVRFKNGSVWHYDDVSADEHQALCGADSVGRTFRDICGGKQGRRA